MVVRVRLFAQLRERAGTNELELELPEGARVRDALAADAIASLAAGLPLVLAVNREYAAEDAPLSADDELALIPPVSGGAVEAGPHVAIVDGPLSLDALLA
ncbi:MAG: MoaD/ThiS family protein, partial [Conexibacter sp.]